MAKQHEPECPRRVWQGSYAILLYRDGSVVIGATRFPTLRAAQTWANSQGFSILL
jgi:hypothetical protein